MAGAETKTRPASAGLRFLGFVAALAPGAAHAGAWVAPKGGQSISTVVSGQRNGLSVYESSGYYEEPLFDDTSLVAAPWFERAYDDENGWRGEATLAVKHAVKRTDQGVLAVQAGALWRSDPPRGCSEGGGEVRALAGVNTGHGGFLNAELAERALAGGCAGERLDLTAGYRASPHWLGMAQVFVDAPHGGDQTVKVQVTVVRFDSHGHGIQVGVRGRIDGGGDEGPALVLALWSSPEARRRD